MIDYVIYAYFAKIAKREGSIADACRYISEQLNHEWQPVTIYNVINGHNKPSAKLTRKLSDLATPPPKRWRVTVEGQSEEQFNAWMNVPMEERVKALDDLAGYHEREI